MYHKRKKERDSQRQRVYDAEQCIRLNEFKLNTFQEAQDYVKEIITSTWWRKRCDVTIVKVTSGRNLKNGRYSNFAATASHYFEQFVRIGEIKIGHKHGLNKSVILHELAHIYTYRNLDKGHAAHGSEFTKCYLALVRHYLGEEAADRLHIAFRNGNVKYYSNRVNMSPQFLLKDLPKMKLNVEDKKVEVVNKNHRVSEKCERALVLLNSYVNFSVIHAKGKIRTGNVSSDDVYGWMRKFGYRWNGNVKDWFTFRYIKDIETVKEAFYKLLCHVWEVR